MKKTLIIVAHPDLDGASIANHIIIDEVKEVLNVETRDLYKLYPNFEIDIQSEQKALLEADNIIFQFPLYWYSTPSILKEWQDKVLTYGFAFGAEGDKLKNKEFLISTTTGAPEEAYQTDGYGTMKSLLAPLEQVAKMTEMVFNNPLVSFSMVCIPDVSSKEDVEQRAKNHVHKLKAWIAKR